MNNNIIWKCLLFLFISLYNLLPLYSQYLGNKDSLFLQKIINGEIDMIVNKDALKELESVFSNIKIKSESSESHLQFDSALPNNYIIDNKKNERTKIFLSLRPYSIFSNAEGWKTSSTTFPINRKIGFKPPNEQAVITGSGMAMNFNLGVGGGFIFNANKIVGKIFSNKYRIKDHNSKNANAWKTY